MNGNDVAQRVDIDASAWNFNPKNVRIGNATLMCAFAKLFPPGSAHIPCPGPGCTEIAPNPGLDLGKSNLKCYTISIQRGQPGANNPPPNFTVTDQLAGSVTVTAPVIQYVCAPATLSPAN
jgi:hypothetical protein